MMSTNLSGQAFHFNLKPIYSFFYNPKCSSEDTFLTKHGE